MSVIAVDACVSIYFGVVKAGGLTFPPSAAILEVGCAEDDWMTPVLAFRPDLQITGIDWRHCERPGAVVRGDVLTYDFPPASFDAVMGISSIEHIGLGHYEADPPDVDGDRHCLERCVGWLKPGGTVYLDVPYDPDGYQVCGTSHRVYDDQALAERLIVPGLVERGRWFCQLSDPFNVSPTCPPEVNRGMRIVALVLEKA